MKWMNLVALGLFWNAGSTSTMAQAESKVADTKVVAPTGQETLKKASNPIVEMAISQAGKPLGAVKIELYQDKAPATVKNFLGYVNSGFYKGTVFHRVIKGFMVQGGGFTSDGTEKKTLAPVKNESNNGMSNELGTIAMARTSDPDSATAQFYINAANNSFLDFNSPQSRGGYTVFGKVVDGVNIIKAIESTKTAPGKVPAFVDAPVEPVLIDSVKISQ